MVIFTLAAGGGQRLAASDQRETAGGQWASRRRSRRRDRLSALALAFTFEFAFFSVFASMGARAQFACSSRAVCLRAVVCGYVGKCVSAWVRGLGMHDCDPAPARSLQILEFMVSAQTPCTGSPIPSTRNGECSRVCKNLVRQRGLSCSSCKLGFLIFVACAL